MFSLSYRDVEELPKIRGIKVDHATIQRWVFKFTPLMDQNFRKQKKTVGSRWCLDETYIKVNGKWCYILVLLTKTQKQLIFFNPTKKKRATHRFLTKTIAQNSIPELVNIDKSGSNKEAHRVYNRRNYTKIKPGSCIRNRHESIKRKERGTYVEKA